MTRRVIVTGGSSGIGAATTARFRGAGARVAVLDSAAPPADTAEVVVAVDVRDAEALLAAVDRAAAELGGLDVVVACAGVSAGGTVETTPLDEWERVFAINVRGVYLTAKAAIPHLRRAGGGAVVVVASQLGLVAAPGAAAYCASKGAAVQLTRAMAADHSSEGIRVNCVCPGPTATPLLESYFARTEDPEATRRETGRSQLHDRLITPEEVAEAIFYLASPTAASTLGAALVVDAGYSIV
jgi:NAD(P)-dependent dehydrogenase (short-subunit alcohol dehydrogenase family)